MKLNEEIESERVLSLIFEFDLRLLTSSSTVNGSGLEIVNNLGSSNKSFLILCNFCPSLFSSKITRFPPNSTLSSREIDFDVSISEEYSLFL